ncbi:2'-5' RNA ligase family protein [Microvirga aerophila]|uniref:2'-5' RNA ligase n=1 Tax=Microvirga aerophila TaxID=670291 RepID=A0A512C0L1_9HYPH|nr:2'-5' RNA ligase family protein [Microvirga aerophila]GEO17751.1 2'-5' RNA ligase [Microvirga aerophila]
MAFAISLKAGNDTADPIGALWQEVAQFESRPSMVALGYPPHLTLAVYDDIPLVRASDVLREAFAGRPALRLTFTRLRFFDDPLVLWAEPSPSADLTSAHARVHACIDPQLCHPHYRPGAWVPHCTLGTQILLKYQAEAVALAERPIAAFEVVFDVVDYVSFAPVVVIAEQPLD